MKLLTILLLFIISFSFSYGLPISITTAAAIVGGANAVSSNIQTNLNILSMSLPEGWHYGIVRCKDIEKGLYCCLKREGGNSLLPFGRCLEAVPFDKLVEEKAKKEKFKYKIIGISYIPIREYVVVYFIWTKKQNPEKKATK